MRIPPPLDTPMEVRRTDTGVELFHKNEMVASGRPATVEIEIPEPPDFAGAQAASRRYRGFESHYYPGCFVCGPDREQGDGLRIFAGPVEPGSGPDGMVATDWVPDDSLANSPGFVSSEYLWAVLDC